jgi:hypothetical protein
MCRLHLSATHFFLDRHYCRRGVRVGVGYFTSFVDGRIKGDCIILCMLAANAGDTTLNPTDMSTAMGHGGLRLYSTVLRVWWFIYYCTY